MSEIEQLLLKAKHEIMGLRSRNELLSAQMVIVEVFAAALGLKREQQGASIDIAWELQRKIDDLAAERSPRP